MKLGIIGYGNLGKALVRGLVCTGVAETDIIINARSEKTRSVVKEDFDHVYVTEGKRELLEKADAVILVVEPKNAAEVLKELGSYDAIEEKIIISFMAGITRQEIRHMLDVQERDVKIIRVMPNIAISNGNGILGIAYDDTDYETIREVVHTLGLLGYMLKLDEDSLDCITVTAASGLAFGASLMNAYQKASNVLLQDEDQSREITIRVFENIIDMMKRENCSFEDIVGRITTKGGTTEAGMKCLKQEIITETLAECVRKSYDRAKNIM